MADLPNRDALELRFAKVLGKVQGKYRRLILETIGAIRDLSKIPDDLWLKMEAEVRNEALLMMLFIGAQSASVHGMNDITHAIRIANVHASGASVNLASRTASSSRNAIAEVRQTLRGHVDDARKLIDEAVQKAFNPNRVVRDSVTETSRSISKVAELATKELGTRHEKDMWIIYRRDKKLCPVCESLSNTLRPEWSRIFPDGPPAHNHCRCHIRYFLLEG